jgi:hypothetical protein
MHAYECKRHAFNTADWTVMPQCCARCLQFNAPFPPPPSPLPYPSDTVSNSCIQEDLGNTKRALANL